jgi:hypothetical protein
MVDIQKLQRDIKISYNKNLQDIDERVKDVALHVNQEWNIDPNRLTYEEMKTITSTILELETKDLHDEVEKLVAQKEKIEREIERITSILQYTKYKLFNAMENVL